MKKVLLILMLCTVSFASYEAFEKARFTFPHKVLNVERHYFEDRWIHEVTCSNYVYLIIDDTVDTNYVENIYKGDVLAIGDSFVAVTKEVIDDSIYCRFQNIYPENSYTDTWPGKDFVACFWSDEFGEITYLCDPSSLSCLETQYSLYTSLYRLRIQYVSNCEVMEEVVRYSDYVIYKFSNDISCHTGSSYERFDVEYDRYQYIIIQDGRSVPTNLTLGKNGTYLYISDYGHHSRDYDAYQTAIGLSSIDFDGDGYVDFCSTRRDTMSPTDIREGFYIYCSSNTVYEFPYFNDTKFYLGNFIDRTTPCLLRGHQIFYGDSFTDSTTFTGIDSSMIDGLADIDNNGIHEFYDIDSTSLIFYGLVRSLELHAGWNLLSPPCVSADSLLSSIFPAALSDYYEFEPEIRDYIETDYFHQGKGVFVLGIEAGPIALTGDSIVSVSLALQTGWNMVGGPSRLMQPSELYTDSLIVPPIFVYNPTRRFYEEAEVILPGQGFWLLSTEDHVLEVE